ncbi:c-type cytochrome [Marinicella meishanensis]|uniref:c-type cytochrome n=1 Tax=Marinicella meishanensis TaxID=2873263 RepID=UPI001CBFDC9B|nr:c-type cytochrome [Marinicella sp. NBU2979]
MKALKIGVVVGLVLLLGPLGWIYGHSEYKLRQVAPPAPFKLTLSPSAAVLQQGQHITRTRGCFGCHGQQLQGRDFSEQWDWVKRAVAPNLAAYAKQHDPATLERAIRHGIGADGRALWSMPSYNYTRLTDQDLSALILYLQSATVVEQALPSPALGLNARWEMTYHGLENMHELVAQVPPLKLEDAENGDLRAGEYLAMTTCNECHGLDLQGENFPDGSTPNLAAMIKAYDKAQFDRLMKQGVGLGERADLGLMSMVAKDRFAYFTEDELRQLYAYLQQLEVKL